MRRLAIVATAVALVVAFAFPSTASGAMYTVRYVSGGSTTYGIGTDVDGDGVLSWGDWIHVTATPPDGAFLWGTVGVACYYGFVSTKKPGTLIYHASWWLESSNPIVKDYPLDSQAWGDNTAATCNVYGYWNAGNKGYEYARQWFPVAA